MAVETSIVRAKAERIASTIVDLIHDNVATKADVSELRGEIRRAPSHDDRRVCRRPYQAERTPLAYQALVGSAAIPRGEAQNALQAVETGPRHCVGQAEAEWASRSRWQRLIEALRR